MTESARSSTELDHPTIAGATVTDNNRTMITVVVQFIDPADAASDPQAKVQSRACEVPPSKLWTFLNRYEMPDA